MKKLSALFLGTTLTLVSGAALAQQQWSGTYQPAMPPARSSGLDNIGEEQQIVFGVDRVMGISWDRLKREPESGETISKTTTVSLFGSAPGLTTNVPRLALDFFVVESISVGGSFVYISRSTDVETDAGDSDAGSTSAWMIHPRVGYAYAIDETFSLWPRLGITYYSSSTETPDLAGDLSTDTTSGLELTGEVMFGISPFSHFAILIGPYLDLGLSGTTENEPPVGDTVEYDSTLTSFGLAVSIVGYY